jgi:hypothetical protein
MDDVDRTVEELFSIGLYDDQLRRLLVLEVRPRVPAETFREVVRRFVDVVNDAIVKALDQPIAVWVTAVDYGLQGCEVARVSRSKPTEEQLHALTHEVDPSFGKFPRRHVTGFSGVEAVRLEVRP